MIRPAASTLTSSHRVVRLCAALSDAAHGWRVRNSGYRKHIDVSEEVAGKDLRLLVERGFLLPKGEKRGRIYVASPKLAELRARTRPVNLPRTDPFELRQVRQPKLPF